MKRCLTLLIALLLPAAALAQTVYRWVDANGQVNYTQTPPPGKIPSTILNGPPPPSASPNQESLNKSLEADVRAQPDKKQKAEQAAAEQTQKESQCRDVNAQLVTLNAQTANRIHVTQEQFDAKRQDLERFIAANCR